MKWRDHLKVHPAADLLPPMLEAELREFGEDIKKNGLTSPIVLYLAPSLPINKHSDRKQYMLLDGRSRLDAMTLVGIEFEIAFYRSRGRWRWKLITDDCPLLDENSIKVESPNDAYEYVISANIRRRHLTAEQKRDLIAKILQANPEKSDRAIADQMKVDKNVVSRVRQKVEATGAVAPVERRTGKDGKARKQPEKKQGGAESQRKEEPPKVEADASIAPMETSTKSWKVEVVAKNGKRYGNGVRLRTEEEADAYRLTAILNLKEDFIVVATEVTACDDAPSGAIMIRNRKGRFTYDLGFDHGTCHTLEWNEIEERAEKQTLIAVWDKASRKERHDFVLVRKIEIMRAQQEIGKSAHEPDDGLDIPGFLKRDAKVGTA
jgi:hypothetical protein